MDCSKIFLVLSALFAVTYAECGPDGLRCCLSEFLSLVSVSGIKLSGQTLAASCTIREDSLTCMEDFSDQCIAHGNDKLQSSINKTMDFLNTICVPQSEFVHGIVKYEECFQNASTVIQSCYNKTVLPGVPKTDDKSKWKTECCEYKNMRNCAVTSVENLCGATASQLVHDAVMNINGVALEAACEDVFEDCTNAAVTLASSLLTLVSFYGFYTVVRFL